MKALTFAIVLVGTAASISTIAMSASRAPGERPTDLIAADLGIAEQTFITCFAGVSPDSGHAPSGRTQRANKAVLLPCLQADNPDITNDALDTVMDRYRPEGPMHN